ncbi:hypothetical protein TNCV_71081 [Trichonephila clavipes]|nr:hypothetical protein TNCV_71081 [Trichonephila clavipes]
MHGEAFWRKPGPTQGCQAIEEEVQCHELSHIYIGAASSYTYLLALSGGPRWSEEGSYRDLESPRFMTKRHQLWMVPSPPTRILSVEEGGNRPLHHPSSIDPQGEEEVTVCCPPNPSSLGGQPVPGYCAKVIRLCCGWWKYFINRLFLSFSQRVVPNCFLGSGKCW